MRFRTYQFVSCTMVAVLLILILKPFFPNSSWDASKTNGAVTVTVVHCSMVVFPFMVTLPQGVVTTVGGEAGLMPALLSQSVAIWITAFCCGNWPLTPGEGATAYRAASLAALVST